MYNIAVYVSLYQHSFSGTFNKNLLDAAYYYFFTRIFGPVLSTLDLFWCAIKNDISAIMRILKIL